MKNKKLWIVGTALGLSTVMLATVAFAGTGATTGYDALKTLMLSQKTTVEAKNATMDMNVTVSEQGKSLLNLQASVKTDSETGSGTLNVTGANVDRTMNLYQTGTSAYMNLAGSDTWFLVKEDANNRMESRMGDQTDDRMNGHPGMYGMKDGMPANPDAAKFGELFLDTAMGDLKQEVVMTESNGNKTFSLKMDQSNMPELLKAALALGANAHRNGMDGQTCTPEESLAKLGNPVAEAQLKALIPELKSLKDAVDLKDNITVESIDLAFTVDAANQPTSAKTSVVVSGNATDGTAHTYVVDMSMNLSNIGTTVPATFDATGKDIQEIKTPATDRAE